MEPNYIVSVKFIGIAKVYATGTTNGEVKLWDNKYLDCLGVVNSTRWESKVVIVAHGSTSTYITSRGRGTRKRTRNYLRKR